MATDSHIHHVVSRNYFLAYSASVVQKYIPLLSQHIYPLRWYYNYADSGVVYAIIYSPVLLYDNVIVVAYIYTYICLQLPSHFMKEYNKG